MSGGVVDALRLKISSDSIGSLRAVPWELHQDVNVVGSSAERVNSRPKLGSFVLHGPMQGLVQSLINGSPSPTR